MGDRVNFVFKTEDNKPAVVMYLHWGYTDRHETLKAALAHARPRWGDESYCTRMIMSHILKDELLNETGYGIYAATPEEIATGYFYTHDAVVVDLTKKEVDGTPFEEYLQQTCDCGCH